MQTPHDEDELYYVIEGHAQLKVGDEVKEVTPGMVLYIRAAEEHSFFEIQEDMLLLVFFSSGSH
jgi:mannose-6-phosphate isomerase-like protein (cupin superfamily)